MNLHLQSILDLTQGSDSLSAEEKEAISKEIKAINKELTIVEFKLERSEKVKRTTTILLEETIEELEQKRKAVEDLALESSRQASLDRIRAEIASMRSAEDLQQISPLLWQELKNLEVPFIRCGVFIMDEEKKVIHTYLSTPQDESIAVLHLPFKGLSLAENTLQSWREQEIYTEHWDKADFNKWTENLIKQGFIQSREKYEAGSAPETLELHFLPFKQGMLYIGNTEVLSDESLDLGQSLADAFSIAYDRYEDFNKLEIAKQKVEAAFKELRATQQQLVQQEKLASLGQLTAGIAHEIKNPLNFVNNFSEVSVELVEEAREEVRRVTEVRSERRETEDRGPGSEKGKSPSPEGIPMGEGGKDGEAGQGDVADLDKGKDSKTDQNSANTPLNPLSRGDFLLEILDDIEANLRKIHEHGSRADGIVKSMLQHSRGGDGKMEPTPLNSIIKEYVNLAFHGMRAGKEPINVDIDLQLDENVGEVPLVAEDFSRVILNLCNNGFDAMRDKLTGDGGPGTGYVPKLTARTISDNGKVTIEIEDNGPGIPDTIKDNIMQPFFTTKKGTQGTGLGLSITNDIIKAHGGSLDIHSKSGQTVFTITLTV